MFNYLYNNRWGYLFGSILSVVIYIYYPDKYSSPLKVFILYLIGYTAVDVIKAYLRHIDKLDDDLNEEFKPDPKDKEDDSNN